jgi:hypothetical protein
VRGTLGDNVTGSPQLVSLAGTGVPPATRAGTYTITVTAASGALIQTMRLILTVQWEQAYHLGVQVPINGASH